jgi:class 3 adenylate cyclase
MPLYMDLHKKVPGGIKKDELERAHMMDLSVQDKHQVKYHKFWVNEEQGTIFCLVEAPNKEACTACHAEAHGDLACEIIEVHPSDIATFMGPDHRTPTGFAVHPDGKIDSAVRTFLFTDIVGSTSLTEEYGDIMAMSILRKHNEIVRNCLADNNGREVKHTGDGIMATFNSTSKAVRCALEIQKELSEYRTANPTTHLHVKIGINAGEPVTEGDDFFGVAVQLTKRLCDLADPGQVVISEVVRALCMGRNFQFADLGDQNLKGFAQPIKVFVALGYW